jgi:hypothetical protein
MFISLIIFHDHILWRWFCRLQDHRPTKKKLNARSSAPYHLTMHSGYAEPFRRVRGCLCTSGRTGNSENTEPPPHTPPIGIIFEAALHKTSESATTCISRDDEWKFERKVLWQLFSEFPPRHRQVQGGLKSVSTHSIQPCRLVSRTKTNVCILNSSYAYMHEAWNEAWSTKNRVQFGYACARPRTFEIYMHWLLSQA